jgi:hypothetical protein
VARVVSIATDEQILSTLAVMAQLRHHQRGWADWFYFREGSQ